MYLYVRLLNFAIIASVGLIACQKSNDVSGSKICPVTKATYTRGNSSNGFKTFQYDSLLRVIREVLYLSAIDTLSVRRIEYAPASINIMDNWYDNNHVQRSDTISYQLQNGRVISGITKVYALPYLREEIYDYQYNSEGYLTRISQITKSHTPAGPVGTTNSVIEFAYQNGLLHSRKDIVGTDYTFTETYDYYQDRDGLYLADSSSYQWQIGPVVRKLLKSLTAQQNGVAAYAENYTYEYQPDGLIGRLIRSGADSVRNFEDYEYQCK